MTDLTPQERAWELERRSEKGVLFWRVASAINDPLPDRKAGDTIIVVPREAAEAHANRLAGERDRLAARLAEVEKALDDVDAPVTDQHLGGLAARMGEQDGGYSLVGRIRALYSRERIDANRQRARVEELERERDAWILNSEAGKDGPSAVDRESRLQQATEALREIAEAKNPTQWRRFAEQLQAIAAAAFALSPDADAIAGEDDHATPGASQ